MKYALIAINDEETTCSRCGKTNLKRVAWIAPIEDGVVQRDAAVAVGTECANKMVEGAADAIKEFISRADDEAAHVVSSLPEAKEIALLIQELNNMKLMGAKRFAHPHMQRIRELGTVMAAKADETRNNFYITLN